MKFRNNNPKTDKEFLKKTFNSKIYFGPFTGLKIPSDLYNILSVPEILGMYESCLHSCFSQLLNRNITDIVIVGGNNGYYAAGLNYIFEPKSSIVYEMVTKFHSEIKKWFDLNQIENYQILGEATIEDFKNWKRNTNFLLIDCEGYEDKLLNPNEFQWQKKCDILAEIHPFYVKNQISKLSKQFAETHDIELIYDDFSEDKKIKTILEGINSKIEYAKHPNHRWIIEDNKKVYTSGIFMFLKRKNL